MARGVPYDSDPGRDYAAAITALMSGASYAQSARIAESQGRRSRASRSTASRSCA